MADPNVTINFTGNPQGAIASAASVGSALDSLNNKVAQTRVRLSSLGQGMDQLSANSAKVSQVATATSAAAKGINNAANAAQQSTLNLTRMGNAATSANARIIALNQTSAKAQALNVGGAIVSSGGGGGGGAGIGNMAVGIAGMLGLTLGAASVGNELRKLITANMELDTAMSSVAAVGALDKQGQVYEHLTEVVEEFGRTTQFTSTQVATGLKEIVAAGYEATEATELLGDTLALAATENLEMGRASEILVASLQGFGLAADQSTRVTDVMARAANASTASVDGMGESMKFLAPVAKSMGVSIEEASAGVAILANNGIQAGMAGRGLSGVMARMIGPTKEAQDILASLGMTAAEINPEVVGLQGAMSALTKIDNASLVKLFGAENLDIANILKSNANGFDGMVAKMKDVNITAKGMAKIKIDNLTGDLDQMKAGLESIRIQLGKDLYAKIRESVKEFTTYIEENKEAIIENVRMLGEIALFAAKVAAAYVTVKTAAMAIKKVNLAAAFIRDAAGLFAATQQARSNTGALVSNTAAVIANKRARAMAAIGKGAVMGAGVGAAMIDGDDSKGMMAAKVGGGAVAGGMAMAIGGKLVAVLGPIAASAMTGAGAMLSTAAAAVGLASGAVLAASVVAAVAAGLVVGYAAYKILVEPIMESDNKLDEIKNEHENMYLSMTHNAIQNATTEEELARAKEQTLRNIAAVKADIASEEDAWNNDEERIESLNTTLQTLQLQLKLADSSNEKAKKHADIEAKAAAEKSRALQEQAQWERDNAAFQKKVAGEQAAAALVKANMIEAAQKFEEGKEATKEKLVGSQSDAKQKVYYDAVVSNSVSEAQRVRADLEAALKESGINPAVLDKQAELKTADDVARYYGTALSLIEKSGKKNLTGLADFVTLGNAFNSALDNKEKAKGAGDNAQSAIDAEQEKARSLAAVYNEIAVNKAKASGDKEGVKKLEREQAILEKQAALYAIINKPGEADDKTAQAQAKAIATQQVDTAAMAAGKNDSVGGLAQLSRGAQGVNLLFGRSMNAGLLEENKKQSNILQTIANKLAIDKLVRLPDIVFA